jgi:RND family efflux transporter MFP subunit
MKNKLFITIISIIIILVGCNHSHSHETDEHEHDESIQLSAYNADFEIFAEAMPFVAGQTSEIRAHFSHLENFKPLEEGSVTASLTTGTNSITQTLEQPTQTGIYLFTLQPPVTGTGELRFDIQTPEGTSQIIVPGITVFDNEHEAHEAAAFSYSQTVKQSHSLVTFSKEQSWKIDFATEEVSRKPFGQIIRTTAQIQPSQGDERIISANAAGTTFFNASITEGKAVTAGQTLFTIDGSATAENNLAVRYTEVLSEYERAKAEFERKTELANENIISQSELLKAKTEFTNAEAAYNNMQRNFAAGKQHIISPLTGFVTSVLVQNGRFVEAGQPVLVVSQHKNLFLKAELQPKYYDMLSKIISAKIRILNSDRIYSLEELEGRVLSYGKAADLNNPLIPVVFQVNNKAGLLVGSFVELFIITQTNTQAITVPNDAIIEEMGNFFAYIQIMPELFEKRAVRKGVTDGTHTEIIEGIAEGERIVSKGAMFVKLSQASGTLDAHAGHVH